MVGWKNSWLTFTFLVLCFAAFAQDEEPIPPVFKVHNLIGINSPGMDFSPTQINGELIFTTEREYDFLNYGENRFKVAPFLNIQSVKVESNGDSIKYGKPFLYSRQLFSPSHTGPIAFDKTGNHTVFTQVPYVSKREQKGEVIKPQLYEAKKIDGRWKKFQKLPFCDLQNSYGHPALSPKGNKLFFAADLPQGKGGKDIYYVEKTDSTWGKPKNLGRPINTGDDEMFPFYFSDDTLFFASNRKSSLGGLDIYVSVNKEGNWQKPIHLDSTINSTEDDFGIWFNNNNTGYFSSNRKGGMGADDLYFFQVNWQRKDEGNRVAGYFDYSKIDGDMPDSLKVYLMNEDGDLLFETTADEKGNFEFTNLPTDQGFILKTNPVSDAELVLVDDTGNQIIILASNERGEYVYKKLDKDDFKDLALLYEEDAELEGKSLSGQFNYKNLEGDRPQDLKVFLVDDNGVIVFSTNADSRGFFKFRNIPQDQHYMVKIEEEDVPLDMVLFSDSTLAEFKSNNKGEFVYVKLSRDAINSLALLDEGDANLNTQFADFYTSMKAQFRYKNDKQRMASFMKIDVLNNEKELIGTYMTNENGEIKVDSILADGNTYFKIPEGEELANEQIELVVLDIDDYAVAVLDKDKNRFFVYRPLPPDKTTGLSLLAEQDVEIKSLLKEISAEEVYFDLDDWKLKEKGEKSLKKLVVVMKDQEQLTLEIAAHADLRGSNAYNLELTQKRADVVAAFLIKEGIDKSRIKTKAYGESSPIYDCEECEDEEHKQNRRVEFRLY